VILPDEVTGLGGDLKLAHEPLFQLSPSIYFLARRTLNRGEDSRPP